jgi:hypothetical protein
MSESMGNTALEMLGNLRKNVAALRVEMHELFREIEQRVLSVQRPRA